jgi:hypothetical protein
VHPNRAKLTILKSICIPLLSCLDISVSQKIANLENRRAHVEQTGTRITPQLVTRFGAVLDPLRNPFRVSAINSIVSFGSVSAWHEIAIRAQPLKTKYLL